MTSASGTISGSGCFLPPPRISWDTIGAPIQTALIDHPWVVIVSNPYKAETKVYAHSKRRRNAENTQREMSRKHPEWVWEMITNKELAERSRPVYQ